MLQKENTKVKLDQQNNYELFKMFYECTYVEFKGGKFQNGSKRN